MDKNRHAFRSIYTIGILAPLALAVRQRRWMAP